jgi:hypothetical protein
MGWHVWPRNGQFLSDLHGSGLAIAFAEKSNDEKQITRYAATVLVTWSVQYKLRIHSLL